jgi:D-alanyl-D-alanine carboxypeptidase
MKRDLILKMAASSMVFATVLTGCGPFGGGSVASMSSKPATVKDGAKYAKKAEKALAKGNLEDAIAYAERSVAGVGNDPETRALLGQTYLAAGRMASAERSFQDAMELGKSDARTILSLSLAQLGQGKADKAKTLIVNNRQYIPAADYGLALALAGDSKTAIEVLEQAIRGSNVTGRTRQNLGLAYALDGRWKEAKLMAVQDVAPAAVNERVMQWAQMARPGAYQTRIATVLNVTPVANDPGQPVQLALRSNFVPTNVAASPKDDYGREVVSFDRNTPLPAIGPAPKAGDDVDFLAKENNVKVASVTLPASNAVAKAPANVSPAKAQPKPALAATPANREHGCSQTRIAENGLSASVANRGFDFGHPFGAARCIFLAGKRQARLGNIVRQKQRSEVISLCQFINQREGPDALSTGSHRFWQCANRRSHV